MSRPFIFLLGAVLCVSPLGARCRCASVSTRTTAANRLVTGRGGSERGAAERATTERQAPESITLPSGTFLRIRLAQSLDTRRDRAGTPFIGHVSTPLVRDGVTIVPRGAVCRGHLVESKPSGRLKGRAVMVLSLDSVELGGRRYELVTTDQTFESRNHKRRNLAIIGGSAAGGAAIGAVAADGVGAAIGAGAGAAAGTVGAFVTGRKNLRLAPETRLDFALQHPVRVRV